MNNRREWAGLSCIAAIHSEFKSEKGKIMVLIIYTSTVWKLKIKQV